MSETALELCIQPFFMLEYLHKQLGFDIIFSQLLTSETFSINRIPIKYTKFRVKWIEYNRKKLANKNFGLHRKYNYSKDI